MNHLKGLGMKILKKKKVLIITGLVIVGVIIIGKLAFDSIVASDIMIVRAIERRNERNDEIAKDLMSTDEINVILVGTAGPMSPDIAQQCTAVFVGGQFLLFDAGDYAQKRMEQFGLPSEELDAVFLTHFHNDHIADLGEVMQRSYILGRESELVVHGPTGVEDIVDGFNMVYSFDSDHRTEHHGEALMPTEFQLATASEFDANLEEIVVYEKGGVIVTAFQTYHPPIDPVFGYVVEYEDAKIVISGDTLVTDKLAAYSNDADLLVMDIMNYELVTLMEDAFYDIGNDELGQIMFDIKEYHPDVKDVAQMAHDQDVSRLALTHYAPAALVQSMMNRFYVDPIREIYDGELIAGSDGTTITIPLSDE